MYHNNDFEFEQWALEATSKYCTKSTELLAESFPSTANEWESWNLFFLKHKKGDFFKPRRYLSQEFSNFLPSLGCISCGEIYDFVIVEVGCGHGCSMFPLLETFSSIFYVATDYSDEALSIISSQSNYQKFSARIETCNWDVIKSPTPELTNIIFHLPSTVLVLSFLAVFTISAIHPDHHLTAFRNIAVLMHEMKSIHNIQSVILFRDYGVHDMTMYRHRVQHAENFYRRTDGTLAYYFTTAYLSKIAQDAGLVAIELEYATVRVVNRKTNVTMNRVFVHAVFKLQDI